MSLQPVTWEHPSGASVQGEARAAEAMLADAMILVVTALGSTLPCSL